MKKNKKKIVAEGKGIIFNFPQTRDLSFRGITFKAESVFLGQRNVEVHEDLDSTGCPIYRVIEHYGFYKSQLLIDLPVDSCCIFQGGNLVVNNK